MFVRPFPEPILVSSDLEPSVAGCRILGVFNPGVIRVGGETILLLRVAETPVQVEGQHRALRLDPETGLVGVVTFHPEDLVDASDSRILRTRQGVYLTSMSHFRVARSHDGLKFRVEAGPALEPQGPYEAFGIEDPRITEIDGVFHITYSAVSPWGICTALAVTTDFRSFRRLGNIFHPDNKDVTIFPRRIGGQWWALHRPSCSHFGQPDIWTATSENLLDWGHHHRLLGTRPGQWDGARVGASAVPIETPEGWLELYHGATADHRYCVGAVLLDRDNPNQVLARSEVPLLEPQTPAETAGFFPGVVFSCGAVVQGDILTLYYGASDDSVALATASLSQILDSLRSPQALEYTTIRRTV
jgi:predicted GH43/DUF377 family glycosyl hydrolase